jgi:hypothetical protein
LIDHKRVIDEQTKTIEQLKDLVFQQNIKITLLGSENMELKEDFESRDSSFFNSKQDTSKFNSLKDYKSHYSVEKKLEKLSTLVKVKDASREGIDIQ